jgi:hypothetical protein
LLLSCLGVDLETVLDDYELTPQYCGVEQVPAAVDLFVSRGIARPAAEGMLDAPRWPMAGALQALDTRYGGIDSYLVGHGGMTKTAIDSLRHRLIN